MRKFQFLNLFKTSNKPQAIGFKSKSFTLIEIIIYIAVLFLIMAVIVSFFLWSVRVNIKSKVARETFDNARRAMEIMTYEIKHSTSIYTPNSIFDTNPGQLSLETTKNSPTGETKTYIDFYLSNEKLCFKREETSSICLTSDEVKVTSLVFIRIQNNNAPSSIRIGLEIEYNSPSNRPEWQKRVSLFSSANIRTY